MVTILQGEIGEEGCDEKTTSVKGSKGVVSTLLGWKGVEASL